MKTMNKISKSGMVKIFAVAIMALAIFVGLSYVGSDRNNPDRLVIDTAGFNKAFAASSGWDGVRAFATLLRAASQTFNTLYEKIQRWGLFNYKVEFEGAVPATDYYVYVSINKGDKTVTSTVDAGPVPYTNGVQIKHGDSSGEVVFQLFFDNPNDSSGGDGALLIVKPYYFELIPGTVFSDTGVFEARIMKPATDTIMYISFNGHPWKTATPNYAESGRVKMVDDGTNYNITGLIYVYADGSDLTHTICTGAPPAQFGNTYYTLAYIAKNSSPYYSTALWGWNDSGRSNQACSLPFSTFNYGHFNATAGFVCDGSPSVGCPDGDPYPLNSSVDALYTGMAIGGGEEFNATVISTLSIPTPAF
jgi:hypothetical protein